MTSIVILGMHRSGTSAITRALNLLGAALGPSEDVGEYWERAAMRSQCDALLERFDGAWDCPGIMPEGWESLERVAEVDAGALAAIAEYGSPEVLLWKDPRASLTLAFWRNYLGADPIAIIIYRHPEEVWASLDTRNGFGPGLSFALWERYNSDALRSASGLRTVVFAYSDLVQNQSEIMTELAATLARWGVSLKDPSSTDMELRADQRHHHAPEHFSHPSATQSQQALFAALEATRGVHESFSPPAMIEPSPLSLELIQMRRQLRMSRRELWRARSEHRSLSGSRRKLLSLIIHPERMTREEHAMENEEASSGGPPTPPGSPSR